MAHSTNSSALRLSVWLFDDYHFHFLYMDQVFLFAFRTVKGEILQNRVLSDSIAGLVAANRAKQPFSFHILLYLPFSLLLNPAYP